jgi:tripartite-type tricarboxylate transporter receptor subunit TctC
MVGHSYLATQAKPDGHTVGIVASLLWGDAMLRAQARWSLNDLEPIGYLNSDALTWVGRTDGPTKGMSLQQIIQAGKDKPGTIRIATVPGSMWDYLIEQIEASSGAKFLRVPFQGGGAGITALVGGNVDVAQGFYSEYRGHLAGNMVAPLAVAAASRMDFLKDMPTFNEVLGANEYLWQVIRFAVVPRGTPADRKAYLGAQIRTAMNDPELTAEYKKQGVYFDPKLAGSAKLADDLATYVEAERQFYVKTGRLK